MLNFFQVVNGARKIVHETKGFKAHFTLAM